LSKRVAQLIDDLDAARGELKGLLRGKDAKLLAKRPPSGDWSIVENVRHLIFAEQIHLMRFMATPVPFSAMGLVERTDKLPEVGTDPTTDMTRLLREWDRVHRQIRDALRSAEGDVAYRLERHIKHLRRHTAMIAKLLRRFGR
jgi:hypothetical protein